MSAAAKRVRASGGGPQDFLLEAESIKKIYNSHFTSTTASVDGTRSVGAESKQSDKAKSDKVPAAKELSTVATQGSDLFSYM